MKRRKSPSTTGHKKDRERGARAPCLSGKGKKSYGLFTTEKKNKPPEREERVALTLMDQRGNGTYLKLIEISAGFGGIAFFPGTGGKGGN